MKANINFISHYKPNSKKWIIPGVIPENSLVMISGQPGVGKSFLLIDLLAADAARSASVFGETSEHPEPSRAHAVYVCAESGDDVLRRIAGVGVKLDKNPMIAGFDAIDLSNSEECRQFAYFVREKHRGSRMIAYSTFNRMSGCIDENSTQQMTAVWENIDMIRSITKMTQIVEHHTSAGSDRPRGSTVADGLLHTMIHVSGTKKGLITVSCRKQRLGRPFDTFKVQLVDHEYVSGQGGEQVNKLLVGEPTPYLERVADVKGSDGPADALETADGTSDTETPSDGLTGNARALLDYAEANGSVSWREIESLAVMSEKTFYRTIKKLENDVLLVNVGKGVYQLPDDV